MLFQSFFIYTLVFSVLFFCGIILSKRTTNSTTLMSFNRWENWLPILFFTLIFGLRYNVGTDYLRYLYTYNTGIGIERYESIFQYIGILFRSQYIHYSWYFALWSFLQIFFVYYALRDERRLIPYVVISLIMGQYFIHWMNGIRQDTAACIFFYSVLFICDRKWFKYILACIIMTGFHSSAIILIPLYFLLVKAKDLTYSRIFQSVLLTIAFMIALTKRDYTSELLPFIESYIVNTDYEVYTESAIERLIEMTKAGSGISFKILFLINLCIIYYSNNLKSYFEGRKFTIYYNLYFWGAVFQLFFINNLLLARPFRYFRLFNMLMIAYLLFYLYKNRMIGNNFFMFTIIVVCLLLLFFATIINEPFSFIWDI